MSAAQPLPEGTVTFLFTDIEGSTRLWEQYPEAMEAAHARHDALAAAIIQRHAGTLVKSRGERDSLFAVFGHAVDAAIAATDLQRAFLKEAWPAETALRVRIALHTGNAVLRDGDYYGSAVNRCARLRAAAHGGQVLLSLATEELVREALPDGASLRDLGLHRLRDLGHPEHIFQLLHPDLPADFPPLASLDALPNNLPQQVTSFIGREKETAEIKQLLGAIRLLTLTGAGGTGKTRLALQVAADLLQEYPDGVWLVELAPLADPALVPQTIASVLSVREEPGKAITQTLVERLKSKRLLLVLDNCEHLLTACAQLADALLRGCREMQLLATSREGLNIPGETTVRVPSLSSPDPRHLPTVPESLAQYEAVHLFLDRARSVVPAFVLTPQNAPAVAQVCQRLDGIPLAVELAAARVKSLTVEKINERLHDMFRLLTGGSRTALPRQQTLRALIDWSYDLLSPPEQELFRRLSVFAGGWTLEAAEGVCLGEGVEECEVLDLLTSLVEKSLVLYEERGSEGRYWLLETVRQYARERLLEAGEADGVRARHRDWFLALAEQAQPKLRGAESSEGLDLLEREHDNLRAAVEWSAARGDGEAGLRLGAALWGFWVRRGYLREGRERLAVLLTMARGEARTAACAEVLNGAGTLAYRQGEYGEAQALQEEGLSIRRELGDDRGIANSLNGLANVIGAQGDVKQQRELFEESLAIFRKLGGRLRAAIVLSNLGEMAHGRGDYGTARALLDEALAISREVGDKHGIAGALNALGRLAHDEKDYGAASALHRESLAISDEVADKRLIVESLEGLAAVDSSQAQSERAARLLGGAEGLREAIGWVPAPYERARRDRTAAAVRAALSEEAYAAAWAEGRALSLAAAVEFALEENVGIC